MLAAPEEVTEDGAEGTPEGDTNADSPPSARARSNDVTHPSPLGGDDPEPLFARNSLRRDFATLSAADERSGVFVSPNGHDTDSCGTLRAPCESYSKADSLLSREPPQSERRFIFAVQDSYAEEPFVLTHSVISGYEVTGDHWTKPNLTARRNVTGGLNVRTDAANLRSAMELALAVEPTPPPLTPKEKPSWSRKAVWAVASREGGCVELEHILERLPELENDPDPHGVVARLKQKGIEASAEDVAESEGRMVKVTVPGRGLAMAFVRRSLCRELDDRSGAGSQR